jgi:hypothetical protein
VIGRARGDLLCRSDEHLAADRDGLPLRGKRDRWPDLCKHAHRRASLSAQTETPDASTVMLLEERKPGAQPHSVEQNQRSPESEPAKDLAVRGPSLGMGRPRLTAGGQPG